MREDVSEEEKTFDTPFVILFQLYSEKNNHRKINNTYKLNGVVLSCDNIIRPEDAELDVRQKFGSVKTFFIIKKL